eukprot:5286484-Amphidinium_carterae.1
MPTEDNWAALVAVARQLQSHGFLEIASPGESDGDDVEYEAETLFCTLSPKGFAELRAGVLVHTPTNALFPVRLED